MSKKIDIDAVNQELAGKPAKEIISWAYHEFGDELGMLSSMQRTASAITHMIYSLGLTKTEIMFIDTQYHFQETLDLRDELIEKYGLNIKTYYPEKSPEEQFNEYGKELYLRDQDYQICCKLRKEVPYLKASERFSALISGLMRSEGGARKNVQPVLYDSRNDVYKIHPILEWTMDDVNQYNQEHDVPVHKLHFAGYPSIGCWTCTTPVRDGEDERAGRWRHVRDSNPNVGQKLYCGINLVDMMNKKN
jgi:phosphoadenosine phosphosulfate reductase